MGVKASASEAAAEGRHGPAPRIDEARLHRRTDLREGATAGASSITRCRSAVPTLREQNPDAPNPAPHAPTATDSGECPLRRGGGPRRGGGAKSFPGGRGGVAVRERAAAAAHGEMRRQSVGRRGRRGRRATAFQEAVAAWRTRGAPPQPRESASSPKKLNSVVGPRRTSLIIAAAGGQRRGRAQAAAEGRRRRRGGRALRAAAAALVLEAVDSDSTSGMRRSRAALCTRRPRLGPRAPTSRRFVDEGAQFRRRGHVAGADRRPPVDEGDSGSHNHYHTTPLSPRPSPRLLIQPTLELEEDLVAVPLFFIAADGVDDGVEVHLRRVVHVALEFRTHEAHGRDAN